jgi:predicted dehydrogenase
MAKSMSRRVFFQRAAGGLGLSLAAPYFLTGRALAAPGRPGANDRIGLGYIGVGIQGTYHVRNYSQNKAFTSLAVCDVNRKMRADAAKLVSDHCTQYSDFRRLLDRKDIDAVLIAGPEHWHALQSIMACQAGKDVYCEKPMSHTVREGQAMVRAVRRYNRVFQTGAMQRSSSEFLRCCRLVRSGRIGRVKTVYVRIGGSSRPCYLPAEPVPPGLDWDLWLGPAPWRPYNRRITPGRGWFGMRDFSGGSMCDWGAHHFDIAQWGLGRGHGERQPRLLRDLARRA